MLFKNWADLNDTTIFQIKSGYIEVGAEIVPTIKVNRFNWMPSPWREIGEAEYYHSFDLELPQFYQFKQVYFENDQPLPDGVYPERKYAAMRNIHIHWFGTFGMGLCPPRNCHYKDGKISYTDKARFFMFGQYQLPDWTKYGTD